MEYILCVSPHSWKSQLCEEAFQNQKSGAETPLFFAKSEGVREISCHLDRKYSQGWRAFLGRERGTSPNSHTPMSRVRVFTRLLYRSEVWGRASATADGRWNSTKCASDSSEFCGT